MHSIEGSGLTLVIGIALALWAGLGVLKVMQTAMNTVWNVPFRRRPNFLKTLLRAAIMLVVLGGDHRRRRGRGKRRGRRTTTGC